MRMLPILFALLSLPAVAAAHISDMPLLQHALEHGWLVLVVIPLLLFLLPFGRSRR